MRGGCEWGHSKNITCIPHVYSRLPARQGTTKLLVLLAQDPILHSSSKRKPYRRLPLVDHWKRQTRLFETTDVFKGTSNSQYIYIYTHTTSVSTLALAHGEWG